MIVPSVATAAKVYNDSRPGGSCGFAGFIISFRTYTFPVGPMRGPGAQGDPEIPQWVQGDLMGGGYLGMQRS